LYYGNGNFSGTSNASATFIRVIDGLIGSWHLDEGSGTTAYDSSGNDNDGTIYGGATWVDGKFGKALNFDGSDDYVNCGNNFVLEDFTICWWEYPTELASGKFYSPICRYYKDGPVFQHENEGARLTMYKKDGDSFQELAWGGVGISINQWYFIAVTFKSSTRVAELYVNGTSKGTLTFNDGTFDNTHDFIIGARVPPGWRYFKGKIDEVLVFNKTLSVEEILDLYNNYGYTTENYPGKVLVRKYTDIEPIILK